MQPKSSRMQVNSSEITFACHRDEEAGRTGVNYRLPSLRQLGRPHGLGLGLCYTFAFISTGDEMVCESGILSNHTADKNKVKKDEKGGRADNDYHQDLPPAASNPECSDLEP